MIVIESKTVYSSDGLLIRRVGSESCFKRCTPLPGDTPDSYEEVAEPPKFTRAQYVERVQNLISERYSVADELAIQRQKEEKPEEFAAYFSFCEECKAEAKRQLEAEAEAANNFSDI